MTTKKIPGFLSAGLCLAILLTAGLLGTGAAEQSYYNLYSSNAPQTAQERADLFKALQSLDAQQNATQAIPYAADPYKALQNPYVLKDPQAALEQANTLKLIQKLNAPYYSSRAEGNWDYWTNMWLNGPQA